MSLPQLQTRKPKRLAGLVSSVVIFLGAAYAPVGAQSLPRYILGPPDMKDTEYEGIPFSDLFKHPDQWAETRSRTDCILYADHAFNIYSDDELAGYLAQIKKWNLKLELEVGALKEWKGQTGKSTFENQAPMWDRIQRLGGNIYSLAFDEPLCNVREYIHKPDEYGLEETAKFIALVRQKYPDFVLGDIEPYPSIPAEDHIKWIDSLQKRLADMHVKGLQFYRMDIDWEAFIKLNRGNWLDVKKIENHCESIGLPFGLIYWAPNYGGKGTDDATWYVGAIYTGGAYSSIGGAPQQYIMESWVPGPLHTVPEDGDFTFTRAARDFARKFVKPAE